MPSYFKKPCFYRNLLYVAIFILGFGPLVYSAGHFIDFEYFLTATTLALFILVAVFIILRQWERALKGVLKHIALRYAVQGGGHNSLDSKPLENGDSELKDLQQKHDDELGEYRQKCEANEADLQQLSSQLQEKQLKMEEVLNCERNEYQKRLLSLEKESSAQQKKNDDVQRQHEVKQEEYRRLLQDQRELLDRRQKRVSFLENKVRDLSYEVKALLQIGEMEQTTFTSGDSVKENNPAISVFQPKIAQKSASEELHNKLPVSSEKYVKTPYDAVMLLQKGIAMAEKFTGSQYLNNNKYSQFVAKSNKIDRRRLWDSFQNESSAIIVYYSKDDKKIVFVNGHIKKVLGWDADKFSTDFNEIIFKGMEDWNNIIDDLLKITDKNSRSGYQTRLLAHNRAGQEVLMRASLGRINQGIFKDNILAVLYPAV